VNKYDDYTTLGRGGSDTTAVALAASLQADACEIYTDVDGVFTADPRVVKNSRKLNEITYDEMLELASLGAGVLHNRSVELAKKFGVQLVVRSSLNNSEGTIVKEEVKMEKMLVSGVASDRNTARIAIIGLEDHPGVAFKLFNHLARHDVNVDIILQSVGRDGTKDISFTIKEDDVHETVSVLERHREGSLKCQKIDVERDVAKVSIVGAGMMSNAGVAAKMFEALYDVGVNIKMISTSEIRVTVLIDDIHVEKAMNAVHDKFVLSQM
jgi:aspartate kinase